MMGEEIVDKYKLVILFNQAQIDFPQLSQLMPGCVDSRDNYSIGYSVNGDLELTVFGTLQEVDKAHKKIEEILFQRKELDYFRQLDTAGDTIRNQVYPILSEIEQDLRAFINRCLISVFGFQWWSSIGEIELPGIKLPGSKNHPLELMTIENLVSLVTFKKAPFDEKQAIPYGKLSDLVNKATSFEEFKSLILDTIQQRSLWNDVFSKAVNLTPEEWGKFEKQTINYVIDIRNRVMHHRVVHYSELEILEKKREKINELFSEANIYLSEQEQKEISLKANDYREMLSELVYEHSEKNTYYKLYEGLKKATNLEVISKILEELEQQSTNKVIEKKEYLELLVTYYSQLQDILQNDFLTAKEKILENLLPLSLETDDDLKFAYRLFREILTEWIEQYSQNDLFDIRNNIYEVILSKIGTSNHDQVCYLISSLGFSNRQIIDSLWQHILTNDNPAGDVSLSTLSKLSHDENIRNKIVEELHRRSAIRFNNHLFSVFYNIGQPESISIILDNWINSELFEEKKADGALAFTAIREILDRNPSNVKLHEVTWEDTKKAIEQNPEELYWDFDIGHILQACNSRSIIPEVLDWPIDHPEWFKEPEWVLYLLEERFSHCVKPNQVKSWFSINNTKLSTALHHVATKNTENDRLISTIDESTKINAWNMLFRGGCEQPLDWFDAAVTNEDGRFVRKTIMEYFACFKIDPLPAKVIEWISEEFNCTNNKDSRDLSYRQAAIDIAKSSGILEAFQTILNFGFTLDGLPLRNTLNSLANISLQLMKQEPEIIIQNLIKGLTNKQLYRQRIACGYALKYISSQSDYHKYLVPYHKKLIDILLDETRVKEEKGSLVKTLSWLDINPIPDQLLDTLRVWGQDTETPIGMNSVEFLARKGFLVDDPILMRKVLGLEKIGNSWVFIEFKKKFDWQTYIIGILYNKQPTEFAQAMSAIIENGDYYSLVNLLPWLPKDKKEISEEILSQLMKRLNKNTEYYSEPILIEFLIQHSLETLLDYSIQDSLSNWMPEVGITMANTLYYKEDNSSELHRISILLEKLLFNSNYAVRRATYRAYSKLIPERFVSLCLFWAKSEDIALNIKSAEASEWINQNKIFQNLFSQLTNHSERRVRETILQSWNNRRNRIWARDYLDQILNVSGETNQEVLENWKFGEALSACGDDESIYLLKQHLSSQPLPENIRFWLQRIIDKTEKNWKKKTKDWPEKYYKFDGAIKVGKGTYTDLEETVTYDIQYRIWITPAKQPGELNKWGGVMEFQSSSQALLSSKISEGMILLENDGKGNAIWNGNSGNIVTFLGNGPAPSID